MTGALADPAPSFRRRAGSRQPRVTPVSDSASSMTVTRGPGGPVTREFGGPSEMERRPVQYCLRLPQPLYRDAMDVALVFDLSLNQFLAAAIEKFVASQMRQESTRRAIEQIRAARSAGLVSVPADPAGPKAN